MKLKYPRYEPYLNEFNPYTHVHKGYIVEVRPRFDIETARKYGIATIFESKDQNTHWFCEEFRSFFEYSMIGCYALEEYLLNVGRF